VNQHFWDESKQEVFEHSNGEVKRSPVMTVFQHTQHITPHVNLRVEVHFVENLDRDLTLSFVLCLILLVSEAKVFSNWLAWELDFLVYPGRDDGKECPESDKNRHGGEEGEEDEGLESATNFVFEIVRDNEEQSPQEEVGETSGTSPFGWEWGILDGW